MDGISPAPKKRRGSLPEEPPPEEEPPTETTTVSLTANKSIRRITLDLMGRFPLTSEVEAYSESANSLPNFLDTWLTSPSSHIHLARTVSNYYKAYSVKNLNQLGLALPEGVTETDFLSGLENFFRYFFSENFKKNRTLKQLLSGRFFLQQTSVIEAMNLEVGNEAFINEATYLSLQSETNANVGLLNLPSLRASLHHSFNSIPFRSTYLTFKKLFCSLDRLGF